MIAMHGREKIQSGKCCPDDRTGKHVINIYIHSFQFGDNVHLMNEASSCLSDEELVRADRLKIELARKNFLISHYLLRQTLSRYLQTDTSSIRYRYGEHGKPHLDTPASHGLNFNLSHSGDRLLIAVCHDCEIGVDIELIQKRSNPLQLARHFMAEDEVLQLSGLEGPAAQREFFFNLWTRKEAYVKSLGKGLFHPLNKTVMNEVSTGVHVPSSGDYRDYRVIDLDIDGDYKAAVAIHMDGGSHASTIEVKVFEQ